MVVCVLTILEVYSFRQISNITTKFSNKKVKGCPCPTPPPTSIMKIFKDTRKLKDFHSEYTYIYYIDSTVNTFLYLTLSHIRVSNHLYINSSYFFQCILK